MEFRIPQDIKEVRRKAQEIISEIYQPEENQLLKNDMYVKLSSERVVSEIRRKAIAEGLWAIEMRETGGIKNCFMARSAIEGLIGGTVLPSIDFGGNGDLLALSACGSDKKVDHHLRQIIEGKEDYDSSCLELRGNDKGKDKCFTGHVHGEIVRLKGCGEGLTNRGQADVLYMVARISSKNKEYPALMCLKQSDVKESVKRERLGGGLWKIYIKLEDSDVSVDRILLSGEKVPKYEERRKCLRSIVLASRSWGAGWRAIDIGLDVFRNDEGYKKNQAFQGMFADSVTEMHASRLMTFMMADRIDRKKFDLMMCLVAKIFSCESAERSIERIGRFIGRPSFSIDCPLDELRRLVRLYGTVDSASEIDRMKLALMVMGKDGRES